MTDRELRKLRRADLLELLIAQGKETDQLRAELEEAKAELADRRIKIEQSGSVMEAALLLNGVFEAARAACSQYEENIRTRAEELEQRNAALEEADHEQSRRLLKEAQEQADKLLEETRESCARQERECRESCERMTKKAEEEANGYWKEVSDRVAALLQEHGQLSELISSKNVETAHREAKLAAEAEGEV